MLKVELKNTACNECGHEYEIPLYAYDPIASKLCPNCKCTNYVSRYERIDIGLSEVCNLACNMCRRPQERTFMPKQRVLRFFDEAKKIGVRTLSFSGGEPFVHPDFRELLAIAVELGFDIELVTNGTLLRASDIALIEKLKCITISVDGPRQQHDFIRGKEGTWDKTMASLSLLAKSKAKWGTNTVIQAHNADVILATWQSIIAVGRPSYIALTNVEVVPETAHLQPDTQQIELIKCQIDRIKMECAQKHVHFNDVELMGRGFKIFVNKTRRYRPIGGCSIPGSFLGISEYGIFPCWHQGRYIKTEGLIEGLETEICRSIISEGINRQCVGCNAANYSWSESWVNGIIAAYDAGEWLEGVVYLSATEREAGHLSNGNRTLPILERKTRDVK